MVFLFHFSLTIQQRDAHVAAESVLPTALAPILTVHAIGFLGVQLFFVISGFCIHYSFLSWRKRSGGRPLREFFPNFFHRRFWRIVPPYLLALLTFYFVKTPHPFSESHLSDLFPHLALANTLVEGRFFQINPSFWSVAVEWQLYLAYPLVLWLFLRFGNLRAFLVATAVAAGFRFLVPHLEAPYWVQNLPFRWWYDWTIGVLIAAMWSERRRLFPNQLWVGVTLGALTYFSVLYSAGDLLKWLTPPLFFAYVVEACVWSTRPVGRLARLTALLGVCSYSLYLWHQPLMHWSVSFFAHQTANVGPATIWIVLCFGLFAIVTAMSAVAYLAIEKPSVAFGQWLVRPRPPVRTGAEIRRNGPDLMSTPSESEKIGDPVPAHS